MPDSTGARQTIIQPVSRLFKTPCRPIHCVYVLFKVSNYDCLSSALSFAYNQLNLHCYLHQHLINWPDSLNFLDHPPTRIPCPLASDFHSLHLYRPLAHLHQDLVGIAIFYLKIVKCFCRVGAWHSMASCCCLDPSQN